VRQFLWLALLSTPTRYGRPSLWRTLTMADLRYGGPESFAVKEMLILFSLFYCYMIKYCRFLLKCWKKDRFIARYSHWLSSTADIFKHEVENSSCTNPTLVHRSW